MRRFVRGAKEGELLDVVLLAEVLDWRVRGTVGACYNAWHGRAAMKPLFEDTSPEAEKVLIEGIRARSAAQRFAITRGLPCGP